MTYTEARDYIGSLQGRGWRMSLDRIEELCRRAGLADRLGQPGGPQFIHVAGTNGKGTTTGFVRSILHAGGFRTGSFFSPFVYDFRERVQLGEALISRAAIARLTTQLRPLVDEISAGPLGPVTEFEFKTLLGFVYWSQKRCDWVALEVGLGGRLDATNVVHPACSVVVSIGMDHMHILGDTHAKIAAEKAGILKANRPAVMGNLVPEAAEVVEAVARDLGCPLWRFGKEIRLTGSGPTYTVETPQGTVDGLRPRLAAPVNAHNMSLAVAAVLAGGAAVPMEAIREGVAASRMPGRFEVRQVKGVEVLLDGAHNPDSAAVLAEMLQSRYPDRPVILVTGMLQGHEPIDFYRHFSKVERAFCAPIDFHRTRPPGEVAEVLEGLGVRADCQRDSRAAMLAALKAAQTESALVLVTGSFYLVGEIGRAFRGDS